MHSEILDEQLAALTSEQLFTRIRIPVRDIAFSCVFEERQLMLDQDP
jgi:hypothetical protein